MGIRATDKFNRPDDPGLGANWETSPSDRAAFSIVSNEANSTEGVLASGERYVGAAFPSDHYSQAVVADAPALGRPAVTVRHTLGAGSGYDCYQLEARENGASTTYQIIKTSGGGRSGVTGILSNQPTSIGAVLRLEAIGSTLIGYRNGVEIRRGTDSEHTGGAPGLHTITGAADTTQFDDWEGGDFLSSDLETKGWLPTYPTVVAGGGR